MPQSDEASDRQSCSAMAQKTSQTGPALNQSGELSSLTRRVLSKLNDFLARRLQSARRNQHPEGIGR